MNTNTSIKSYMFNKVYLSFVIAAIFSMTTFNMAIAQYRGTGHFASSSLKWCHFGQYPNENNSAASQWSFQTDITITSDCSNIDVQTFGYDLNVTNLYGYAYICSGSTCDTSSVVNNTYTFCEARSNTDYLDSWSYVERKYNAMHELGHCWSLAHRSASTQLPKL